MLFAGKLLAHFYLSVYQDIDSNSVKNFSTRPAFFWYVYEVEQRIVLCQSNFFSRLLKISVSRVNVLAFLGAEPIFKDRCNFGHRSSVL